MSLLANLTTNDAMSNEKDSVGGSRVVESNLYHSTVNMAYLQKSAGGALGLTTIFDTENKETIKETLWLTGGDAKGNKNTYQDKDGNPQYLPGFLMANSLALLATGKEISALDTEEKVLNIYNSEAKAEVPTKVQVIMELLGQEIILGVIKQTVDKTTKDGAGVYQPTGETRDENTIDKFFRAKDKMTTAEIRAQATEPAFYATWGAKWIGKTRDKAKGAAAGGVAGAPKAAGAGTAKPGKSLFG